MLKGIIDSFKTTPGGFSGRKISAALSLIWACYLADGLTGDARMHAVFAFLIFSAVCLGLVTIPELIKFLSTKGGFVKEETISTTTVKEEKTKQDQEPTI